MEFINATTARQGLYSLLQSVNKNHRPIYISGKHGNAVLLSEDDWNAIEETLFLNSVPGFVDGIKESETERLEDMADADDLEW